MDFYFIAYPHTQRETVVKDLEKYLDISQSYIISMETSLKSHKDFSGEHYHFAVEDFAQYNNYCKNILIRKYQLKGKAIKDGHGNQYGKVRKVRDQELFLQYIVKEENINNIIFRKIDLKTIQEYMRRSYKKEDRQSFQQQVISHLIINMCSFQQPHHQSRYSFCNFETIEKCIIQYIVDNGAESQMTATKSKIKHITSQFLLYHYEVPTVVTDLDDEGYEIKTPEHTIQDIRYRYIMRS